MKGFKGQAMRLTYWKAAKVTFPRQFEGIILEARDKPIVTMLEIIRRKVMTRLVSMREVAEKYSGPLCLRIQKKFFEIVSQSNNVW
ncbi:hypothetical protein GOBAR_DD17940 [Gossypium barbadense]|nr:hypothetical protein GOBAR_DD17940 [Gossypium barbadense]